MLDLTNVYLWDILKKQWDITFTILQNKKVFVSRNAVFLEKEFLLKEDSGSKIELSEVHDPQIEIDQPIDPMRSTRVRTIPERYGFLVDQDEDVTVVENDEPTSYDMVLKGSDSELWLKAMKSEMDSMYDNQVWNLVDPPEGIKPIWCKQVFKKKTDMKSNVITYKARLVAKEYRQR